MGCCGGGHNNHQNMNNHRNHDMKKDMHTTEGAKHPNMMTIFTFILIGGIALFYVFK